MSDSPADFPKSTGSHVQEIRFVLGENPFHALLEAAPDAMVIVDQDGRIVALNRQAERMFLYRREELLGQPLERLLPERARPKHVRHRQDYYAQPRFRPMGTGLALAARRKDGSEFPVEISLSPLHTADGVLVISAIRDIADRNAGMRAQTGVDERARHLASFPELNPNPVLEVDVSGHITFANPASHQILERLGLDPANVNAFLPADIDGILRDWDKKNASSLDREIRLERKVYGVTVTLVPELKVARIYGHDITARKQAEEHIVHLNQELTQRARDLEKSNEELEVTNEELRVANEDLAKEVVERRRAEELVKQSEEKYAQLFQKGAIPASLTKLPENVFADVNEAFEKLLGYTKAEVIGKTSLELGISRPQENAVTVAAIAQRGLQHHAEKHVRTKSGEERIVSLNVSAMELGGQCYALSTLQDVTERKRAEDLVRYQAALVDNASDAIISSDENFVIRTWNKAAESLFGWRAEEVVGKSSSAVLPAQVQGGRDRQAAAQEFLQEGVWRGEVIYQRKDGQKVNCLVSSVALRDHQRKITGALAMYRDITERMQTEEALRRRTEELQAIMEAVPTAVFITRDPDARSITGNRAARELVQLSRSANISKSAPEEERPTGWQEMRNGVPIAPKDLPIQQAARGTEVRDYEMDLVFRDGTVKSVLGNATPLRDEKGHPQGGIAVLIDVTQQKRVEENLREAVHRIQTLNQDLEQRAGELEVANEELERLATSLALDLRSPLVSLHSLSRLIAEDYATDLPPQAQQLFRLIDANAEEMDQLTYGLLQLMRLTRQTLRKQELQPEEIVRAAWAELQPQREGREVGLVIGALPVCRADPLLLKQVWGNLLSNALKATRNREPARIEIGARPDGDRIVYFVKDDGVGFDMSYAGTIFRAFQRYHHPEEWDGSGVGLASVDSIIRRHGGRVWAEGEVNKGATIHFTLG